MTCLGQLLVSVIKELLADRYCLLFKDNEWQGVTTPTFFGVDRVWVEGVGRFGVVHGG